MNFFEGLSFFVICMAIFIGGAHGIRKININLSPCVEVYNGGELIYKGSSVFYDTGSRGTATIFRQYDEKIFFQKKIKEIISNKITVNTVSCEEIKGGDNE